MTPEQLAQGQLDAYNAHDLDAFCSFFSDDIRVFDAHTGEVLFSGKKLFRERYTKTLSNSKLHCTLINRMVQENIVIDQESVVGLSEDVTHAIAIYHTSNHAICEVHFY
ncbi:MAG: steroid delta-isomerase [Deltaproteobacteria bacterium]|nr:steroid delta-isomerase [Deltaproteobacteria bacterium]